MNFMELATSMQVNIEILRIVVTAVGVLWVMAMFSVAWKK